VGDSMFILTALSILLFFVVAAMSIAQIFQPQDTLGVKSRIQRLSSGPESLKGELEQQGLSSDDVRTGLFSKVDLQPLIGRFTGEGYFNRLDEDLARADIPLKASEFLILRLIFVAFVVICGGLIFRQVVYGLLCGVPALFLHMPLVHLRKKFRIAKFNVQLADFLILIVNSLRAGQTFMQGCSVAVKETGNPISMEFKQVIKEVNLGIPEAESLENMVKRVPTEDLQIVVSAYVIQRKVGGNLAEILETSSTTIRERLKIMNQINVLTTQGKLSGGIVACLPFFIGAGINFINPEYMRPLFYTLPGQVIIGLAVVMQLTGAFVIWRIVDIEV